MNHSIQPQIVELFDPQTFADLRRHVREIRRIFDWPGNAYHDSQEPDEKRFNRWFWHNLPLLRKLHHSHQLVGKVSRLVGIELKPSYVFLSLYGPEGTCPLHTDRPQCQFTADLCVDQDATWPIYVETPGVNPAPPYVLEPGQALVYSGTGQQHFRKPMKEDSTARFCNLAFFHFVPIDWMGEVS